MSRVPSDPGVLMGGDTFPSEAWLEAARQRAHNPAFAAARAALDALCERHHTRLPDIPGRQAGYYHEYFCPDHAVQLVYAVDEPVRHACPIDGRVYVGEPYDGARLWVVNDELSNAAFWLAFRAALQPEAAQASADRAKAAEILLGYSERYPSLAPTSPRADGYDGIATFSALDESVWVIRLAWAFGLLGTALSGPEQESIRERLFDRASDHLWRVRWPEIHNVSVWNASALIALAIVRNDEAALRRAVDGPLGLRDQLAQGVRADGLWWEVSLSYHYYTLAAAIWGARSLLAIGRSLDDGGAIRRMFVGPLALTLPDLTLPAVNDCWYHIGLTGQVGHGIPDSAGFHEVGYGWTGNEDLGWVIAQASPRDTQASPRPRAALEALLDGRADLPTERAGPPTFPIDHSHPSGLAVLRGRSPTSGSPIVAILKAGPGARDHGHPDQLAIQLFGGGARLLDDLGTAGYGIPLNEAWYRATAGHCTIVVDGMSQPITDGQLGHQIDEGEWAMAEGSVSWPAEDPDDAREGATTTALARAAYAGVQLRRQLVLADGYLIDVVDVACDRPRTIDWVILPRGIRVAPAQVGRRAAAGALGTGAGFEEMSEVRILGRGTSWLRWRGPTGATLETYLGPPESGSAEDLILATAPAAPASERLSVLVRRRVAEQARFVAVFVPGRAGARRSVASVSWSPAERSTDGACEVTVVSSAGARATTWIIGRGAPRRSLAQEQP